MRLLIFTCCLWAASLTAWTFGAANAWGCTGNAFESGAHLSRHDLHHLLKTANTPEQYETLARYFREKAGDYREQEWQINGIVLQRQIRAATAGGKYWNQVQSANSLYRYYISKARQMSARADEFDARAQRARAATHP